MGMNVFNWATLTTAANTFVQSLFFYIYFLIDLVLFGGTRSWLQHVGSFIFVVACSIFSYGMWELVP